MSSVASTSTFPPAFTWAPVAGLAARVADVGLRRVVDADKRDRSRPGRPRRCGGGGGDREDVAAGVGDDRDVAESGDRGAVVDRGRGRVVDHQHDDARRERPSPEIASEPAMPRNDVSLPAATSTDWLLAAPLLLELMFAPEPM